MSEQLPKKPESPSTRRIPGKTSNPLLPKSLKGEYSAQELNLMLAKIKEIRESLDKKLEALYEEGRAKNIDVKSFFGDVFKLTVEQVDCIAQRERELIERLKIAIPPESCIKAVQKSQEKLSQERKGKFRGTRQKWIPM